jgi:hypothetical protein
VLAFMVVVVLVVDDDFHQLAFDRSSATVVVLPTEPYVISAINPKALKLLNVPNVGAVRSLPLFRALPQLDTPLLRENLGLSKDNPQAFLTTIDNKTLRVCLFASRARGDCLIDVSYLQHVQIDHRPSSDRNTIVIRIKHDSKSKNTLTGKKRTRSTIDADDDDYSGMPATCCTRQPLRDDYDGVGDGDWLHYQSSTTHTLALSLSLAFSLTNVDLVCVL